MQEDTPVESTGIVPGESTQADRLPREADEDTKAIFAKGRKAGAIQATGQPKQCPVCTRPMTQNENGRWRCTSECCQDSICEDSPGCGLHINVPAAIRGPAEPIHGPSEDV